MMKDNTNSGFSLIELIIAMTILLVLSGMIFLGSDSARRKETEKYAAALGNEILMAQPPLARLRHGGRPGHQDLIAESGRILLRFFSSC